MIASAIHFNSWLPPVEPLWLGLVGLALLACAVLLLLLVLRGAQLMESQDDADFCWRERGAQNDELKRANSALEMRCLGAEADLRELKGKMWGEPVLEADLRHMLEWIDEARASTFHHQARAERYRLQSQMNLGLLHATHLALANARDAAAELTRKVVELKATNRKGRR